MAEVLRFTVPPDCGGMNAKWFLKSRCGLSTRMITRLKREKDGIMMNGKILRTVDPVEAGAELLIHLPQEENSFLEPVEGELDILFEDSHLLVINKPPFMPVHPVKQHRTDTLANRVAWYAAQKGEPFIFRAHNRLDRNTSGLVLLAKDKFTVNALKGQVHKVYFALVHGKMEGSGTVSALRPSERMSSFRFALSAASQLSSRSLAFPARSADAVLSTPNSMAPALRIRPSSPKALSAIAALHFRLQPLIDLRRDLGGEGPLQRPGLHSLFETGAVRADIGAPAGCLAPKVQADLAGAGTHHADQLPLGFHLAAAQALAHRYFLFHGCRLLF